MNYLHLFFYISMREISLQPRLCLAFWKFEAQIMLMICLIKLIEKLVVYFIMKDLKKLWKKFLKSHYFTCNLILTGQPDNYKNQRFYHTLSIKFAVFFSVLKIPIAFFSASTILAEFLSASEYAYIMLSFFRNFSLNMLIVVMRIKKRCMSKYVVLRRVKHALSASTILTEFLSASEYA